jgi:Flp pilus assembly pilin Flp
MRKLLRDCTGADMVEYALLAGFMALVIASSAFAATNWQGFGANFLTIWTNVRNILNCVIYSGACPG